MERHCPGSSWGGSADLRALTVLPRHPAEPVHTGVPSPEPPSTTTSEAHHGQALPQQPPDQGPADVFPDPFGAHPKPTATPSRTLQSLAGGASPNQSRPPPPQTHDQPRTSLLQMPWAVVKQQIKTWWWFSTQPVCVPAPLRPSPCHDSRRGGTSRDGRSHPTPLGASQLRGRWGKSSPRLFDEGWDTGRGQDICSRYLASPSARDLPNPVCLPGGGFMGHQGTPQPCTSRHQPWYCQLILPPYHANHHQNNQNPLKVPHPHAQEGRRGLVHLIKYR